MLLSEHILWTAYLEDKSCWNIGFTGGIALKKGKHCRRACFIGGLVLVKGILHISMCCTGTQV